MLKIIFILGMCLGLCTEPKFIRAFTFGVWRAFKTTFPVITSTFATHVRCSYQNDIFDLHLLILFVNVCSVFPCYSCL